MITEDTLRAAMRERADLAPDVAEVRAEITRRLDAGRRGRLVPIAAAAACAAVAVAVPVVVLRPDGGPARPTIAATTATHPETVPRIMLQPMTAPFTVGVLPAGWIGPGDISTGPGYAERSFVGPDGNDWLRVRLWDPSVTGRPENAPVLDGGQFPVHRAVGGSLQLGVNGSVGNATLNRVADSVDLRHGEPLTAPFRLTHLPPGVAAVRVDRRVDRVGMDGDTGGDPGRVVRSDPPALTAEIAFDDRPGTPAAKAWLAVEAVTSDQIGGPKYRAPNMTVLGRPARWDAIDHDAAILQVFDLRGLHIWVTVYPAGHAGVDRAEMVRIVEGMRLVADPTHLPGWIAPLR
ncbi:MAG: hypothetical protein V7637_3615 [Mycobacteriales bacterium]